MIDRDVTLLLIGAAISLMSGLIGALVQHFLSLRADRIKREREKKEEEAEERKKNLLLGVREKAFVKTLLEQTHMEGAAILNDRYDMTAEKLALLLEKLEEEEREEIPEELAQLLARVRETLAEARERAEGQEQDEGQDEPAE
jgi:hypothetical protein